MLNLQLDLIGDSLYNYVNNEDHEELQHNLMPDESCWATPTIGQTDSLEEASNSSEDSSLPPKHDYSLFKEQRRTFMVRMAQRMNSRKESVHHEFMQINGVLKLAKALSSKLEIQASQKQGKVHNFFCKSYY